jgi:hypothetical protein
MMGSAATAYSHRLSREVSRGHPLKLPWANASWKDILCRALRRDRLARRRAFRGAAHQLNCPSAGMFVRISQPSLALCDRARLPPGGTQCHQELARSAMGAARLSGAERSHPPA